MKATHLGLGLGVGLVMVIGLLLLRAPRSDAPAPPEVNRGDPTYRTYVNLGCHRCHGPDLAGTHKAPGLGGLDANWNVEELQRFLRDPVSFADDARLQALRQRYAEHEMPAYDIVDSVLADVSAFLLNPAR